MDEGVSISKLFLGVESRDLGGGNLNLMKKSDT